jgi:hypothetical protein
MSTQVTGKRGVRWSLMSRFTLIQRGQPYLWRLRIFSTPWCSLWLHRIYGPDTDLDPHDHPRPFIKAQLTGGYIEVLYRDPAGDLGSWETRIHRRGSVHIMRRGWAHKIIHTHGTVRTLLLTGRQRGSWSFWTPSGPVDQETYLAREEAR